MGAAGDENKDAECCGLDKEGLVLRGESRVRNGLMPVTQCGLRVRGRAHPRGRDDFAREVFEIAADISELGVERAEVLGGFRSERVKFPRNFEGPPSSPCWRCPPLVALCLTTWPSMSPNSLSAVSSAVIEKEV